MKEKKSGTAINWHYITVSMILVVILLLLVLYVPNTKSVDYMLLQSVRGYCAPLPGVIPVIINEIGRYNYFWALLASCSVLVSHKYYLKAFLLIIFTQGSYVLTDLFKNFVCRQRPCGEAYAGYSFPSGHSLTAMCFFGILIYLVMRYVSGFWRYFLISVFGLLILLSALSRLYLGVHYPIDVIAGLLLGFIMVNLYIILCKAFGE